MLDELAARAEQQNPRLLRREASPHHSPTTPRQSPAGSDVGVPAAGTSPEGPGAVVRATTKRGATGLRGRLVRAGLALTSPPWWSLGRGDPGAPCTPGRAAVRR